MEKHPPPLFSISRIKYLFFQNQVALKQDPKKSDQWNLFVDTPNQNLTYAQKNFISQSQPQKLCFSQFLN